jgi:hypothetical protein
MKGKVTPLQTRTVIRSNAYYDSVTLMRISTEAGKLKGVCDVLVGMGTELNNDTLKNVKLQLRKPRLHHQMTL